MVKIGYSFQEDYTDNEEFETKLDELFQYCEQELFAYGEPGCVTDLFVSVDPGCKNEVLFHLGCNTSEALAAEFVRLCKKYMDQQHYKVTHEHIVAIKNL